MAKLAQILAVESGIKTRVYAKISESHKALQQSTLFNGHARRYKPLSDDPTHAQGEQLPDENKKVSHKTKDILKLTAEQMTEHFDVAAMRDWTNMVAKADIVVDGDVILKDVPVTYLLMLEKQLSDLHTFVQKLPVLDPAEVWTFDRNQDLFASQPASTARSKKVTRPMVLYDATPTHPAQVKEVVEDVFAGLWTTTKFSSALPAGTINDMLTRVERLQKATKFAREQANASDVVAAPSAGTKVFDYLFAPALGD